jgi:PBP1b-binding outer membrane lipoprotein LpoB
MKKRSSALGALALFLTGCGGWQPIKPQSESVASIGSETSLYTDTEMVKSHPTDYSSYISTPDSRNSDESVTKKSPFTLYLYPNKEGEKGHFIELLL